MSEYWSEVNLRELDEIIDRVNEEKRKGQGKPAFRVSELATCRAKKVDEEKLAVAMLRGTLKHREIQATHSDYISEFEVALDRGDYLLVGHIDLLDLPGRRVIEIKPFNMKDSYYRQLSAYVVMLRQLTGLYFDGEFLLYHDDKYVRAKSVFIDTTVLDAFDKVVKEGLMKVRGEYCEGCLLRPTCDSRLKWKGKTADLTTEGDVTAFFRK